MRIGQVAQTAGVSVQTVRFYERRGLLPVPRRLRSGYRDYAADTVNTVLRIKRMQEMGFTLRELTHFIRSLETEPHNYSERRSCVEAKLYSIDEQIERLQSTRNELSARLLTCECCNAPN
jgi:DNA-binding transcriptional MerR regulator